MGSLGKIIVFTGILLIIIGVFIMFAEKSPWFGRLPGDVYIKKENFTFGFPVVTCIIISLLLSIIFSVFIKR